MDIELPIVEGGSISGQAGDFSGFLLTLFLWKILLILSG